MDNRAQSPRRLRAFIRRSPTYVFELFVGTALLSGGNPGGDTEGIVYATFATICQFVYGLGVSVPEQVAPEWSQNLGYWTAASGLLVATAAPIDSETIYHNWGDADGSTPNGDVTFVLNTQVDGSAQAETVSTRPIIATFSNGRVVQQLVPNVNSDLSPDGSYYTVTENIVGATPVSYPITVPTGGPWDLWTLRDQS